MNLFLLTQASISYFTQFILFAVVTVFVVSRLKQKSTPRKIAPFFICLTLYSLVAFLTVTLMRGNVHAYIIKSILELLSVGFFASIAYQFPASNAAWRKENAIYWVVFMVMAAMAFSVGINVILQSEAIFKTVSTPGIILVFTGLLFGWTLFILLRQFIRFESGSKRSFWMSLIKPQRKQARSIRAMFMVEFVIFLLWIIQIYAEMMGKLDSIYLIQGLGILWAILAFILIYLNITTEPTSLIVKVVAIPLVLILSILGSASWVDSTVRTSHQYKEDLLPAESSVYYQKTTLGYKVSYHDENWILSTGSPLRLGDDELKSVDLPFIFELNDRLWNRIFIHSNGIVLVEDEYQLVDLLERKPETPVIAGLLMDMDPSAGGEVLVNAQSDQVVITWKNVPLYAIPDSFVNLQIVLYSDSSFSIHYGNSNYGGRYTPYQFIGNPQYSGYIPSKITEPKMVDFERDLPVEESLSRGLLDDYYLRYRVYLHQQMVLMMGIITAACLVLLFIFPFFFRWILIRPLDQLMIRMAQVNQGDWGEPLEVQVNDEIGFITHTFNHMLETLKNTQQRLVQAKANLEYQVAERTSDLSGLIQKLSIEVKERERAEAAEREAREVAEALNEASRILNSTLDFDSVLNQLLELTRRVVPYDTAAIFQLDGGKARQTRMTGFSTYGSQTEQSILDLELDIQSTGTLKAMLDTRKPLVIPDVYQDPRWIVMDFNTHIHSWLGAPVISRNEVVAFLCLDKVEPDFYTDEHAHRLASFAEQAALALENTRFYNEVASTLMREKRINELSRAMSENLDLQKVLGLLPMLVCELFEADGALAGLVSADGQSISLPYIYELPEMIIEIGKYIQRGDRAIWQVIDRSRPQVVTITPEMEAGEQYIQCGIQQILLIPLTAGRKAIGVVAVFSRSRERTFTDRDIALAMTIGQQAGVAVQNAILYEEVQRLAIHDPLTGLYNRRSFFEQSQREVERAVRYHEPLSVLMIDLDHFKLVNDHYGHLAGDQVLQGLAQTISRQLRISDLAGRYGGEEFVVLLPVTPPGEAFKVAERIRNLVDTVPFQTDKGEIKITLSIGISGIDGTTAISLEKLLDQADQGLYAAKAAGRNQAKFYSAPRSGLL